MANVVIQIRVGKHKADEKGREYRISLGDPNSKIQNITLLDHIENALFDKLTKIYGDIYQLRGVED